MRASQVEYELHTLILAGDSLALAKLYDDVYGELVVDILASRYPKVAAKDETLILAAVNEAFFGYYRNPATFDPDKSTLQRFLEVAAERDLQNILAKEAKHGIKKNLPEDVELETIFWNSIKKEQDGPEYQIIAKQTIGLVKTALAGHFDRSEDRIVAAMIIAGERETNAYSAVLQIDDLTQEEQMDEVKRVKDRIKKVLDRKGVVDKIKNLLK